MRSFLERIQKDKEEIIYCDIGANIGLYSLFAAKRLNNIGKVIAFEPQPETFKRFIENINLNRFENIIAINKAVGDKNGSVAIVQSADSAKTFVSKTTSNNKEIKIDLICFDTFLIEKGIEKIDYLKIDVEGFEYYVLKGMQKFLRNTPPKVIQIELYDEFLKRSGSSLEQTINYIRDLDYTFWKLDGKIIKLYECKDHFSGDLFLIKKEKINEFTDFLK